jgi:cell division transport system permease protein
MKPFMATALKQGILAGILAALMVCGIVYGAEVVSVEGLSLLDYREVGIIVAAIVVMGLAITLLFSLFAVNKFVNMKSNKIHLY